MHLLLWAASTPDPQETALVDPNLVTPGPWGFAVIVVIAVALILLVLDMLRRIRRARYRADVREELDAEELAASQGTDAERQSPNDRS